MRLVRKTRMVAALASLTTFLVLASASPASASHITVTDLTQPGFVIGREVRKAVFGLNMSGGGSFNGLQLEFTDVGGDGDFDLSLLSDLEGSPDGVAIYRDDSVSGGAADRLDAGDSRVSTGFSNSNGSVDVAVSSAIPAAPEGDYTFFVAVQTSSLIETGDDFTVGIPSVLLGCAFDATGAGLLDCPSPDTTETITADATAPTASVTSTPADVDDNIVWTFSENVFGVSEENVVLRLDGSNTDLPATVTYDGTAKTATINPTNDLTSGATYDTIVNPSTASPLFIADAAGNLVEITAESFQLADLGFTPGTVQGNFWRINNGFDSIPENDFVYGSASDKKIVGDWNGDGRFTPGIVRGNRWYLNNNTDAIADVVFDYGSSTDIPIVGDWDGDGDWTPGVVRGNLWLLNNSLDPNADSSFRYGSSTDRPVTGDWDGDGEYTPGVVRGNVWHINNDLDPNADESFAFGKTTDRVVVGDWNGDGTSTPGVVRGFKWFLANNLIPTASIVFVFGESTDLFVAGDWDASIESSSASSGVLSKIIPGR